MPPKRNVRGSHRCSVKTAMLEFEPLTEDELAFCWKALVDESKLSVPKLQKFMQDVCGTKLSNVQAKDLLDYMDANGDDRVGMEDFKNFMSVGRLVDTDPKSFMWAPKAKYRAEHGIGRHGQLDQHFGLREDDQPFSAGCAGLQAAGTMLKSSTAGLETCSNDNTHGAEASDIWTSGTSTHSTLMHPRKPTTEKKGKGHPRPGTTHTPQQLEHAEDSPDAGVASQQHDKARRRRQSDPQTLSKIEHALARYEQNTWDKLLKEEAEFKRSLFDQFSGGKDELDVTEYHRMLMRWFPLASWCVPGGLRAGDSLAALEYVMRREREQRLGKAAAVHISGGSSGAADEAGAEGGGGGGEAVIVGGARVPGASLQQPPPEAKMTYNLWLDVLNGKYRPDEHVTKDKDQLHHAAPTAPLPYATGTSAR